MSDLRHARATSAGRTDASVPEPRFAFLWATLTYTLATLTLGYPALAGQFLVTRHSDQYIAGYAFREFAGASLRAGQGIPLWNPFLQGGMPYVAAMHGDIFYPTFLLRLLLPTDVAMTWGFVVHVILAGVFTYGFLRAVGVGFAGALVGGLVYLMSGPIAGYVSPGHDGKLFVSALLPAACWLLVRGVRDGQPWSWGLLAIVTGLGVLSPHPQLLQYMLLATGAFGLWLALERRDGIARVPRPVAARRLGYALASVLLGFAMGAVQYLPVREYVDWSPRAGGKGWEHAISYSMPLEEVFSTYLPQFSGILDAYWGRNGIHFHSEYFGAAALLLAVAGLAWSDRNGGRSFPRFWVGVLVISLLWSLGGSTPFYRLVYALVPGTTYFRAPSTMMYVTMFSVAVLAALGAERAVAGGITRRFAAGWLIAAGLVALLASGGALTNLASSIAAGLPYEGRVEAAQANHGAIVLGAWRSFLFVLGAAAIAWAVAVRKLSPRVAPWALAALLAADYWTVLRHYWQFVPSAAAVYASDPGIARMKAEREPYRVFPAPLAGAIAYRDPFMTGDALMVHEVPNVVGYHGNELGRYQRLVAPGPMGNPLLASAGLRAMLNVKFLLTDVAPDAPLDPSDPTLTVGRIFAGATHEVGPFRNAAGSMLHLYRLADGAEAAWVASGIVKAADDAVLSTVQDPRFTTGIRRQVALFDTAAVVAGRRADEPLPAASSIQARVERSGPGAMKVHLNAPAPAGSALVVSENYFPGWRATASGAAIPVSRANLSLIGIALPAGATQVDLAFDSAPYETGKTVSLVALALAIVTAVAGAVAARRRGAAHA